MRTIKFRAFDKVRNRLTRVIDIWGLDGEVDHIVVPHHGSVDTLFREFELMQWTGEKDRNGIDIYEGDIIQLGENKYGDVYFDRGSFWVRDFYVSHFDNPADAFGEGLVTLTVVSNIYEGPEFLTAKNN